MPTDSQTLRFLLVVAAFAVYSQINRSPLSSELDAPLCCFVCAWLIANAHWGHIGRIWERPVFIAFIRDSRYSREMLDANPEFTVNVPINGFNKKAFAVCGTKSGRDMDKITEAGLTLVDPEKISVPAIREFPLTLECRVIYRQEQNAASLPEEIRRQFYTIETEDHITYYGEIVDAYIIED